MPSGYNESRPPYTPSPMGAYPPQHVPQMRYHYHGYQDRHYYAPPIEQPRYRRYYHKHVYLTQPVNHPSLVVRLIYFLFIGCWLGSIWLALALLLCVTIIGLPLGVVMLYVTPRMYFL
jgi:hypothetical protein